MIEKSPKVSIITINYNQAAATIECIKSLQKITYPAFEIIVVDNASQPSQRINPSSFPDIKFIQSEINLGFAGGNNLAIAGNKSAYFLLINNDTVVPSDFLEPLVKTLDTHQEVGIVSPKIIYYNSNNIIQYAGTFAINTLTCRGATRGYKEIDKGQYNHESKTQLAHGACMLIKAQVIEKIGMLNESYFLYYEEYDFCERAKKSGFPIYYNGNSTILHKESISVGKDSPLKSYYMAKNRIQFAYLNFNGSKKYISILFYLFIAMPKNIVGFLLQLKFQNARAILKGSFSFLQINNQPLHS